VGLLTSAYEDECDVGVRRGVVRALAMRLGEALVPLRALVLARASDFDPDPGIRLIAERARRGLTPPELPAAGDALWLHAATEAGATPEGAPLVGYVVRDDGLAVPVVFDGDGSAIVPAPSGPARLVLAPRVLTYQAPPYAK
jgi:hypothetical protein